MNIAVLFDKLSSAMTVISFLTFIGILWWTFIRHRSQDFASAAQLPFADDDAGAPSDTSREQRHV